MMPKAAAVMGQLKGIMKRLVGGVTSLKLFVNETCTTDFLKLWDVLTKMEMFAKMVVTVVPVPQIKIVGKVMLKVVAVGRKGMEFIQKAVNALKAFKEKFCMVIDKVSSLISSAVPLLESKLANSPQIAKIVLEKVLGKLDMGVLLGKVRNLVGKLSKPLESKAIQKIGMFPVKVCQKVAKKIVNNKIFTLINRPIKRVNKLLAKEFNVLGQKMSVGKIFETMKNPKGAVKKLLAPILKQLGPALDPIKSMVQTKLKAILSDATKKLPLFKMPKMAVPKVPTMPKGSVSPQRLRQACLNTKWVNASPSNLCNCCVMGMLSKEQLKGPMMIVLLLRSKICNLMLSGANMTPLPPPPPKKPKKKFSLRKLKKLKKKLRLRKLKKLKKKLRLRKLKRSKKKLRLRKGSSRWERRLGGSALQERSSGAARYKGMRIATRKT